MVFCDEDIGVKIEYMGYIYDGENIILKKIMVYGLFFYVLIVGFFFFVVMFDLIIVLVKGFYFLKNNVVGDDLYV